MKSCHWNECFTFKMRLSCYQQSAISTLVSANADTWQMQILAQYILAGWWVGRPLNVTWHILIPSLTQSYLCVPSNHESAASAFVILWDYSNLSLLVHMQKYAAFDLSLSKLRAFTFTKLENMQNRYVSP